MTKRIFRSILAVSLAVLLASLLLIVGVLHGYFQDSVLADLTIRTAYIAHGIENEGIGYLEEDLPGGCRITLVDTDGTVLYDNREDPAQMENHADREEIHEAAMLGQGRAVRHSDTLSEKTIYYALRLSDRQRPAGIRYGVFRLASGDPGHAADGSGAGAGLRAGSGAGIPGIPAAGAAHQRLGPEPAGRSGTL